MWWWSWGHGGTGAKNRGNTDTQLLSCQVGWYGLGVPPLQFSEDTTGGLWRGLDSIFMSRNHTSAHVYACLEKTHLPHQL